MSYLDFMGFVQKVQADPSIAAKLPKIEEPQSLAEADAAFQKIVDAGAESGFSFTIEECRQIYSSKLGAANEMNLELAKKSVGGRRICVVADCYAVFGHQV